PEVPKLLNLVLGAGCAPTPAGGRLDIVGLLSPNGTTAADLLRINIGAGQTNAQSHFPNGRALTDDVTDTLLTVACNNGSAIGDGVNANDLAFTATFPYLASRSEEHTSELQSRGHLVCRLLLEKKNLQHHP